MMIILCTGTGYGAFEIAEHFYTLLSTFGGHSHMHLSGILACIRQPHHIMTKALDIEAHRLDADEEAML